MSSSSFTLRAKSEPPSTLDIVIGIIGAIAGIIAIIFIVLTHLNVL